MEEIKEKFILQREGKQYSQVFTANRRNYTVHLFVYLCIICLPLYYVTSLRILAPIVSHALSSTPATLPSIQYMLNKYMISECKVNLIIVTQPKKQCLNRQQGGPEQGEADEWGEQSKGKGGWISKHRLYVSSNVHRRKCINSQQKYTNQVRRQDGRRVRRRDHLPSHRYSRNTSTRGTAPTEHPLNAGRRRQTSQKSEPCG